MSVDELLPQWHLRGRHQRAADGPAPALLTAAGQVTWAGVPVMGVLMRVRSGGRRRPAAHRQVLDDMAAAGFAVLERTGEELVLGAIVRPWSPGGRRALLLAGQTDPAGFVTGFAAAGRAKMAVNLRVSAGELSTETRVLLTDDHPRRVCGRSWLLIRPFSGLIRREWLAAIARRAREA